MTKWKKQKNPGWAKKDRAGGWLNDANDPGPDWAPFFTRSQYLLFEKHVLADLDARGFQARVDNGVVLATKRDTDDAESRFGLDNLARSCHELAVEQWPARIADHFSRMENGFAAPTGEFEEVRASLRARVYPTDMFATLPATARFVRREFAPGLCTVLVRDLPDTVQTVSGEVADGWPLSHDELLDLGSANVLAHESVSCSALPNDDETLPKLTLISGESFFVASHALHLARYVTGSRGAIVAIPHRHLVLLHDIVDMSVVTAVNDLLGIAQTQFRSKPGAITDQLYWWRDGQFVHLPVSVADDGTLRFIPPQAFVDLLDELSKS